MGGEIKETLIADAIAHAEERGNGAAPTITLDLSEVENAKSAILDMAVAKVLAEAGIGVAIILPGADITLDLDALGVIASADAGSFTVEAAIIPMRDLRGMQAAQVKGYETVVSIDVFVGEEKVDVPLTVSLPYTLKPNENPAAVRVWYMSDSGTLTDLYGAFDSTTGMITFTIAHQSYFVVGYDEVAIWTNIFTDLDPDEWYSYAIAFMNHHGMINGYGNGLVGAEDILSRSQFAALIWALEGKPLPNGTKSFPDVAEAAWYYNAVTWAAENGLVAGYGNGSFGPDDPITREQVVQMLYNYAINFKGYDIPANRDMPGFADTDLIDVWAETAAKALAEAGVLNGLPEGDDAFKPKDDATRAEAAQIFMNFVRFVVGDR